MSNINYTDTWKSPVVFNKQLELNMSELNGNYPSHWNSFIKIIGSLNQKINLLDIGCGVGAYSELCDRHLTNVNYTGIDYAEDAIFLAKKTWNNNSTFITKSVTDLSIDFVSKFNLIHMGALLDVLPNAEEILDFILKFSIPYVLISRIEISNVESCNTYIAYDEITTYKFIHSKDKLLKTIYSNNYYVSKVDGNNLLLELKK